jgi:NADH:ubiquinone reductase (H+-translocating)
MNAPTQTPGDRPSPSPAEPGPGPHTVQRILILGGGFGGFYTARRLQKIFRHHHGVEITLVSRDNYFLMTPLLFEAGSGVLEPRHTVTPVRRLFDKVRFIEADIDRIDFAARTVYARHNASSHPYELHYDQLVLALGGVTNLSLIPGSENAIGFKTLGDAIFLRNDIIDLFERADVEENADARRRLLTFVVIGGGLVGIELMGELTAFVGNLLRSYPRIPRELVRFVVVEAHPRILPEMDEPLAAYAARRLWRRGVNLITGTRVQRIEPGRVFLPPATQIAVPPQVTSPHTAPTSGVSTAAPAGVTHSHGQSAVIEAQTILLAAGVAANPLLAGMPLTQARNGRLAVHATMQSVDRPEVWALGDCACIPDKGGNPYPPLAQHALREARTLADNIAAVILRGPDAQASLKPFVYETLGQLASLGHYDGVGKVMGITVKGFLAWWIWRTYFMLQMPRLERKLRVIMDWTIALCFRQDVAKLDLFGEEHPTRRLPPPRAEIPAVMTSRAEVIQ